MKSNNRIGTAVDAKRAEIAAAEALLERRRIGLEELKPSDEREDVVERLLAAHESGETQWVHPLISIFCVTSMRATGNTRKVIAPWSRSSGRAGRGQGNSMPSINGFGRFSCATALAAMAFVQPGFAADARNGARLAARWCEACHVIAATQHRASIDAAPPFATIASRPNFDAGKIALFLLDPHPKMPDMSLTRAEAADLAAYIGSLAQ